MRPQRLEGLLRKSLPRSDRRLRIGISSCLLGERVRWDGGHKQDDWITERLARWAEFVPVCPEIEAGMGVPREPVHLEEAGGRLRMISVRTRQDWTTAMRRSARARIRQLERLHLAGYVLKKDSPSCGMERVRVHAENGRSARRGTGLFAGQLMRRMPLLPVEEEERLRDPGLRESFIERVVAYGRLRRVMQSQSRGHLVAFHTAHELILLSHSPRRNRELGRLVAGAKRGRPASLALAYGAAFMAALQIPATVPKHCHALQHAAGFLRRSLNAVEKREFEKVLEDYRKNRVPRIVPLTWLRHQATRHGIEYLQAQIYLHPHPELKLPNRG